MVALSMGDSIYVEVSHQQVVAAIPEYARFQR
jgi:hypothetical protein